MKHTIESGHRLSSRRLPQRLARVACAAGMMIASLSLSFAAQAQSASTIEGIFTNAENTPNWTISGTRYGSPWLPSMDGSGWLHLAGGNSDILGQVEANAKLVSGVPIRVEFDYLIWGGNFDGLTLYFADASAASAGKGGEVGGGLGYCGMSGAYLGIGIDDGGNFAQTHCGIGRFGLPGAQQGTAATGPGVRGNSVTVRGPQAEQYPYVTSASLNDQQDICVTCTDRSQANAMRHVVLVMEPRTPASAGYTLSMTVNNREILKNVDFPHAPPKELLMGLASTTGAYGANHEIRNLKLSTQVGGVVVAPNNCLDGVNPQTGRCRPVNNLMKDWSTIAYVGTYTGAFPPQWMDGDLTQAGWDAVTPWALESPTLPAAKVNQAEGCLQLVTHRLPLASPARANQIMVVSRQDDAVNPVDPTESTRFSKYGPVDVSAAYSSDDEGHWTVIEAVHNDKVMRVFDLPKTELVTDVEVIICGTADSKTSPLTEILLWEKK
jgi:hypothetical protein